jgi:hypothetical protein
VIAVRNRVVPTAGLMNVPGRMSATGMVRRTGRRIRSANSDGVLVDVVPVGVMEMTFVKIVDVAFVLNRGVAARGSVLVRMALVHLMSIRHRHCSFHN